MTEPYDLSDKTVNVGGIDFHYSLDGKPDDPVLVLVNMASHNLTCWEPVMTGLLKHFRVLRFDIRGTGKSGWGADEDFTFPQYADDLAGIMQALSIDKAFVLGVAYGARTAAYFALRHPERLTALGLFDVALTPPVEQTGQRALAEKAREMLRDEGLEPVSPRKSWRFYEDREAARKAHTAHESADDVSEALAVVSAPVLVACGRQDMNLDEARRIASCIEGSDFEIMEMTGHASPFFRPDLFVEVVAAFWQRRQPDLASVSF